MTRSFALMMVCALAASANAQVTPATRTGIVEVPIPEHYGLAMGIGLEEIVTQSPVRFLQLTNGGQLVRMAYMHSSTDGRGRDMGTVLLLHGKNFSGFYWQNTVEGLNREGYRVIVPDQIGFGKSSKPDLPYSFDLWCDNTAKLLDELRVSKVFVVGHSMGGMLGVKFARKYPNRVQKLVLEDPIGLEDYRAVIGPVPLKTLLETELGDTDPDKIRAFYQRYFVRWKPAYEQFVEIKARVALSGEFPRFAQAAALTYEPIFNEPILPDLPLLKVPTLLIIGEQDRTAVGRQYAAPQVAKGLGNVPELAKLAAKAIPGAKLAEIAGVGHIPHLEKPLTFNNLLLDFFQQ